MDGPTAVEILRDLAADLPDEAEDHALAALAALSDPDVSVAALAEQLVQERLAQARPHLVAVEGALEQLSDETRPDGTVVTGSRYAGAQDCPDCTRGLRSVGGVMVCLWLPAKVGTLDGKPGDIVACGRER